MRVYVWLQVACNYITLWRCDVHTKHV